MSYSRPSREVDLVSPVIPCFVAVYGAEFGRGEDAETEPLLMMRPPRGTWAFMSLIASCVQRKAPVRLVSTTDFHCSYLSSSSGIGGAACPALLNNRSSLPKVSLARPKRFRTDAGSATSVGTATIRAPEALPSWAVLSSGSLRRPASSTAYPPRERASATARPIPAPAPVTIAIFSDGFIDRPPLLASGSSWPQATTSLSGICGPPRARHPASPP